MRPTANTLATLLCLGFFIASPRNATTATNSINLSNLVELAKDFGVTNLPALIGTNQIDDITIRPMSPEELEDLGDWLEAAGERGESSKPTPTGLQVDGRSNGWEMSSEA